eukprot:COSAG06_NODE_70138_length_193_cov_179.585106_1_plen_31_part_10
MKPTRRHIGVPGAYTTSQTASNANHTHKHPS